MSNILSVKIHPSEVVKDIGYSDLEGTNVVIINTPIREAAAPATPPEGPLLLATTLRDNYRTNASVVDLNGYRIRDDTANRDGLPNGRYLSNPETYDLLRKHFDVHGVPDMVGLSGIITTLGKQEELARMIRELAPNTHLVSGGGLATELGVGLFNYIHQLDGIVQGDGDDVVVKIAYDAKMIKLWGLNASISHGHMDPYYIGEVNGRHRFVYAGDSPRDLNVVPFADLELLREDVNGFSVLEYYLGNPVWGKAANNSSAAPFTMNRSTTFVSSRGCPHACDFCYTGVRGGREYNARSAENVAAQIISHKKKYDVDFVGLVDDNFGISRERINDLVPLLEHVGVQWGTHMRLDEAADIRSVSESGQVVFEDTKRVEQMAKAGCVYIGFGAESASPKVLRAMNKGGFILRNGLETISILGREYDVPRSMIYGIINSRSVGIHSNCTWIMGYPGETLSDLQISIAFIKWQEEYYGKYGEADSVNRKMFTATAYPGTQMSSRPDVMKKMSETFGISFEASGKPVCDEMLRKYILCLGDATKTLTDRDGNPLNYSDMDDETFLTARRHIDNGDLEKVLEM